MFIYIPAARAASAWAETYPVTADPKTLAQNLSLYLYIYLHIYTHYIYIHIHIYLRHER